MRFLPEPTFAHDRTRRVGVLLVNLGTPGCADGPSRARLPRRIPVRSAGCRNPARGVDPAAARRDPSHAAGAVGAEVRDDLDQGRFAAARPQPASKDVAPGLSRTADERARAPFRLCPGRARHALWLADDFRRAGQAQVGGLRPRAGPAALSAVCGQHHRLGTRCRIRHGVADARDAVAARGRAVPRRRRLHPGGRAVHQRLLDEKRPAGQTGALVPRRAPAKPRPGRSLSLSLPQDRTPRRRRARPRRRPVRWWRSSRVSAGRNGCNPTRCLR